MLRQLASAPSRAARLAARVPHSSSSVSPFLPASFSASRSASFSLLRSAPAAAQSRQQPSSLGRWYSTENDKEAEQLKEKEKKEREEAEGAAAAAEAGMEGKAAGDTLGSEDTAVLRQDLEKKTKEALEWKDKYLRAVADFRNLQDRTQREVRSARDFAITQFAKDLVDSVDNLDRALAMVPEKAAQEAEAKSDADKKDQDFLQLVDGLKMTETVLLQTLKKHGLERFDPAGEKFNPNEHEATFMTPMQDKEHNTVFHTQQKGFRLNGRVLRAAKVGVVNNNKK